MVASKGKSDGRGPDRHLARKKFAGSVDFTNFIRRKVERGKAMKYMLLIYHEEQSWEGVTEAERQQIYGEYQTLIGELAAKGQFVSGSELRPVSTATTVRVREGKEMITDGPFAETHEQLGGYFLIEAENLDQATSIAARIPSAKTGTVEIRPLVEQAAEATA